MIRFIALFMVLTLSSLSTLFAQSPFLPRHGADPDRQLFVDPSGRWAVERLVGEAARLHLQNLKTSKRAAFEKAGAHLRSRGYWPTDEVVVLRSIDLYARGAETRGILPASDTAATSEGEVVFVSWDDGDDRTWEGSVYMDEYNSTAEALFDGQIDTADPDLTPVWEETVYYSSGGGGGDGDEPVEPVQQVRDQSARTPDFLVADASPFGVALLLRDFSSRGKEFTLTGSFGSHLRSWGACFAGGCAAAATTCAFLGPGWAKCSAAGCAGAAVGCAVVEVF